MNQFNFRSMASSEESSSFGSPLFLYGQRKSEKKTEPVNILASTIVEKYTKSVSTMVDTLQLSNSFLLDNLEQNVKSNELLNKILDNISNKNSMNLDIPGLPNKLKSVISKVPNKYKIGFIGAAMALGALGLYSISTPDDEQPKDAKPEEIGEENQLQLDDNQEQDIEEQNVIPENIPELEQRSQSIGGLARPVSFKTQTGTAINSVNTQRIKTPSLTIPSDSNQTVNENKDLKISAKSIVFSSDNFVIDQGDSVNLPSATDMSKISFQMTDTSAISTPPAAQFSTTISSSQSDQTTGELISPVNGRISSGFGQRARGNHEGIDYAVPVGTSILASTGGIVSFAGEKGGYGNLVVIQDSNGIETRYAHLSSINVAKGDSVIAGQEIAKSGNTGLSTGPHLHFEVRKNGTPIDPKTMLGSAAQASSGSESPGEPTPPGQTNVTEEIKSEITPISDSTSIGSIVNEMSTQNTLAETAPPQISVASESVEEPMTDNSIGKILNPIDPNDPGVVGISEELMREFFGELLQ